MRIGIGIPGSGARRGVALTPSTTNLIERWVASDLALGAVGSWPSRIAGGHTLTQATGTKQPICTAGGPNGQPYVLFDGIDDVLSAAFTLSQPCTIVWIGKFVTVGSVGVHDCVLGGATSLFGFYSWNAPGSQIYAGTGVVWNTALANGVYETVVGCFNTASSYLRSARTTRSTGNVTGSVPAGGIALGAANASAPSRWSNVAIVEVLVYGAALADVSTAIAQTETYASAAYGVT